MTDIFTKLEEIRKTGKKAALCIITETKGSTPRKAGSKMVVTADGKIFGTIGGGAVEKKVIAEAVKISRKSHPSKFLFNMEEKNEMLCGGTVEIYIEPVVQSPGLIIFGAGHVGGTVAEFAEKLGFRITIVDEREEIAEKFCDKGFNVICENYVTAIKKCEFDENTFIVVTTPKHKNDEEITGICAQKPHKYLGMIGSRKKVETVGKNIAEKYGISKEKIDSINMPIGTSIKAETPAEIAVSIVAKIIDVKNS